MNIGLLLLKKSGLQGSLKFIITLIAAALGTLILLAVLSLSNAINMSMTEHAAWKQALSSAESGSPNTLSRAELEVPGAVLYSYADFSTFLDKPIQIYTMGFTGGRMPAYSPLQQYPKAGEYYVSPALKLLIEKYPDTVLRDRFKGVLAGTIPDSALSSPDELVAITGLDHDKLDDPHSIEYMNAHRITDFSPTASQSFNTFIMTTMMAAGAVGLIIPVAMLITTATRLGARQREARYAALRLIGATKKQIQNITFVDSLASSISGIIIGYALFMVLRPIMFTISANGMRFFPQDIMVGPLALGAVVVGILLLVWLANSIALRTVIASPLGVVRKQQVSKAPKVWSVLPLLLCIGALAYFSTLTKSTAYQLFGQSYPLLLLGLFVITMLSIMFAGAWLIKLYGRGIGLVNRKASGLLVSRRISYEARKTYAGIGGVVLAFFVGSFFATSFSSFSNLGDVSISAIYKVLPDNSMSFMTTQNSTELQSFQKTIKSVGGYQVDPISVYMSSDHSSVISCVDAERLFHKTCVDQSQYTSIPFSASAAQIDTTKYVQKPSAQRGEDGTSIEPMVEVIYLPVSQSSVDTVTAERIVTTATKDGYFVTIINSGLRAAMEGNSIRIVKDILYAGIVLTIIIASMNLVVATVAGLFDRKASFLTLHLSGAGVPFLKRVVVKESLFPLLFISLISVGTGLYTAYVFLRLVSRSLQGAFVLPELFFWVCVAGVIVLSYVGIRMVLPMLDVLLRIENNRSE